MPLSPELREYVDQMPDIYKDVLKAFPTAEPSRRRGESLLIGTVSVAVNSVRHATNSPTYTVEQIQSVCTKLAVYGFFKKSLGRRSVVTPTEVGEDAIEHLTGFRAAESVIPPLGPPPGHATAS